MKIKFNVKETFVEPDGKEFNCEFVKTMSLWDVDLDKPNKLVKCIGNEKICFNWSQITKVQYKLNDTDTRWRPMQIEIALRVLIELDITYTRKRYVFWDADMEMLKSNLKDRFIESLHKQKKNSKINEKLKDFGIDMSTVSPLSDSVQFVNNFSVYDHVILD